jgi:AraC-like DNA-binding protein
MTYSQLLFTLMPLASVLSLGTDTYASAAMLAGIIVALVQGYYLLFHLEILYGIPVKEAVQAGPATSGVRREEYYSDEDLAKAGSLVEHFMQHEKPYLRGKFKVQELAEATGLSVHLISAYVNRKKGMNFFGYINQYRIAECMAKFLSGEHEHKTLEALAEECGFQNRTTFIRVFKQTTGQTPSDYIASLYEQSSVSTNELRQ